MTNLVQNDIDPKNKGDIVLCPFHKPGDAVLVCLDRAHADGHDGGGAQLPAGGEVFGEGDDVDFFADEVFDWFGVGVEVDELEAVDEGGFVAVEAVEEDFGGGFGCHCGFEWEWVWMLKVVCYEMRIFTR